MKQIQLLKVIVSTPHIYMSNEDRAQAKHNLLKKMVRRDRVIAKESQLALTFEKDRGYRFIKAKKK